jgi:protein TonB
MQHFASLPHHAPDAATPAATQIVLGGFPVILKDRSLTPTKTLRLRDREAAGPNRQVLDVRSAHAVKTAMRLPPMGADPLPPGSADTLGATGVMAGTGDASAFESTKIVPEYPPLAERKGIEGWVTVEFTVGVDGSVHNVQVMAAQPHGIFDATVVRTVSRWQFEPFRVNGQPARRRFIQTISFKLPGMGYR